VSWIGLPRVDRNKVALRFQRHTRAALGQCQEIELRIDGTSKRHPAVHSLESAGALTVETVHIDTDIDTVSTMRSARKVEFNVCGFQRRLTLAAVKAVTDFVERFSALRSPDRSKGDGPALLHSGGEPVVPPGR
jgi:hypothetical protein